MPPGYEWRSEEDKGWGLSSDPKDESLATRPGEIIRRWPRVLLAVTIIVAMAAAAGRVVSGVLDRATEAAEQEVLNSHQLVMQAFMDRDTEVLASVLSGRDQGWSEVQYELVDRDLALAFAPWQLPWQHSPATMAPELELSADLLQAVALVELAYQLPAGGGSSTTVLFRRTLVYRRSADRWLLAPPLTDFWGQEQVLEGRYISVVYPERDGDLASRLAADLESEIGLVCLSVPALSCPSGLHLAVELSPDPRLVLEMADPRFPLRGGPEIRLPAPSLVGEPVNEAGYRLLRRGYSRVVISRLITELNGWTCCPGALYYQALLDRQLTQLGVQEWPLRLGDYRSVLANGARWSRLHRLWEVDMTPPYRANRTDRRLAHIFVDFLLAERPDLTDFDVQQMLADSGSFKEWVDTVTGHAVVGGQAEETWRRFLQDRVSAN
jgi:hypothetical protein